MSTLPSQPSASRDPGAPTQPKGETGKTGQAVEEKEAKGVGVQEMEKKLKAREESKKKTKRIKRAFLASGLYWRLAIASILGPLLVVGIFFSADKLKTLVSEIEQKRGQLVALSERETSFKKLGLDLVAVEKEIPLIEKALPNEEGVIEFLSEIEKLERETEVEIGVFSFDTDQPKPDQEGNSYVELNIEVTGRVANLQSFLRNLLRLPVLVSVKTIDLAKMNEEVGKLILRAWLYVDPNFFIK